MKRPYERKLLTQEEYRKQERNKRWFKTAAIGIPVVVAIVSGVAAMFMLITHGYR